MREPAPGTRPDPLLGAAQEGASAASRALGRTLLVAATLLCAAARTEAQGVGREIPTIAYYSTFNELYDGEYDDALRHFQGEWRGAIKKPQTRWLDSICYHTMIGECFYQMGHLDKALEQYTAAIQLFLQYNDWMIRVQFPQTIRPLNPQACPWGVSQRGAKLGDFPTSMPITEGEINVNEQIQRGGVVQQAIMIPIHVSEIVRATTLAIRRRTELLGPLCTTDRLTLDLVEVLARRPGLPNHWSQAWIDVQLGMAQIAAGKPTDAIPTLNRAILAAGQYDHPMTPMVLLELGRLALHRGEFDAALNHFHEASLAAYYYDPSVLEEAFRLATVAHMAANRQGIYPTLPAATAWAKLKRHRHLQASLLLSAAECQLVMDQPRQAERSLADASLVVGRRRMGDGGIGARYHYLMATLYFKDRKLNEGYQELSRAMAFMQYGSRWLFQLARLDQHFLSGNISMSSALNSRAAMDFYEFLLRDPAVMDWTLDPMESLAVLKTPHAQSYEHWFLVAISRKSPEKALEIADLGRRHQFHSSLPFGGRMLSLRRILETPTDRLPADLALQRQDLLAGYPAYAALAQQAQAARSTLNAASLATADKTASAAQRQAFAQWESLSMEQEAILREMAVRREKASLVFPPVRSVQEVRESLPAGQAILAFYAAKGELYGFLLNRDDYSFWRLPAIPKLTRGLAAALRAMGHYDRNGEVTVEALADQEWKKSAQQLLAMILDGSRADFTSDFPELAIVPDGLLWYVPFEALQVEVNGQLRPLIDRFRIRYAPTLALAAPPRETRSFGPGTETAVALGKLHPRDDGSASQKAFEELSKVVPRTFVLPGSPLPASAAMIAPLLSQLIVLDDIQPAEQGPYSWSPIQAERGKPGNMLADWFPLPLGGPEVVMLPGFHTPAENSLKTVPAVPGSDIFLSVCGLMANDARTILLTRWRSGGRSNTSFVQEFAQELPHTTPADAFQRAVLVTAGSRLQLDREPRVKQSRQAEPTANHPLFWAGFMLIDRGVRDAPATEPAAALDVLDLLR